MSTKPIFVATHPRACSTAFERVFMTRRETLQCAHEPFGDSFYYGPERLSERYDDKGRQESGFANTTYKDVLDRLERDGSDGKRVFVKDMAYYLMAPSDKPTELAPSITDLSNVSATDGEKHANGTSTGTPKGLENPTCIPLDILKKFQWTFLIRHPRSGIPSFYTCCTPPLNAATGWDSFMPNEMGYLELRKLFDYLCDQKLVGPHKAGEQAQSDGDVSITVVDADDLLDKPAAVIEAFCRETGIEYTPEMLCWDDEENHKYVADAFAKWNGWHNDAIKSTKLTARTHAKKIATPETENKQWAERFGEDASKLIRKLVDENIPHYEYLKQFAVKV